MEWRPRSKLGANAGQEETPKTGIIIIKHSNLLLEVSLLFFDAFSMMIKKLLHLLKTFGTTPNKNNFPSNRRMMQDPT